MPDNYEIFQNFIQYCEGFIESPCSKLSTYFTLGSLLWTLWTTFVQTVMNILGGPMELAVRYTTNG